MKRIAFLAPLVAFFAPLIASAHEVYVLTPGEIAHDINTPPFSMMTVMLEDMHRFAFWAFIGVLVVIGVFLISISRKLEKLVMPFFLRVKPYAPVIGRVTIGLSFLAGALFQANYGPELPLSAAWGPFAPVITLIMVALGLMCVFGLFTRVAALIALVLFSINVYLHGMYMLTYLNYLGEIAVLLILGAHAVSIDTLGKKRHAGRLARLEKKLAPYAFFILRVCFGISLFYASIYAKFLHNHLALDVASMTFHGHMTNLASSLGFEPHFLVLGAGIVEIVIALFFMFGIEIRFTALFLEFWLSLSLFYFGEVVWPHLILIGIPIAFIFYGYDKYSLEGLFFKRGKREPIL